MSQGKKVFTEQATSPVGLRFSHVYLDRSQPSQDSPRMRRRLSALIYDIDFDGLAQHVQRELGVSVPNIGGMVDDWHAFTANAELRDILDMISVAFQYLDSRIDRPERGERLKERWLSEVERIFREENVHYRVDQKGGVHFSFDAEFESNRATTVSALNTRRYANARMEFQGVDASLSQTPPNGKGAIRSVFTTAECIFRLMFPSAPRLAAAELTKHMPAAIQSLYSSDQTALRAASKTLASLQAWTDAAHFYRHEPGEEEVAQPPLGLAINLVSQGAAFVRWLAEVDAHTRTR